jgi:hypothetical protein
VVRRIEEPDIFAGVGNIGGYTIESSRRAGKVRAIIDDRDHPGGRVIIPDRILLEEMHSCLRDRHSRDYRLLDPQELLRPNVARSLEGEPLPGVTPRLAA